MKALNFMGFGLAVIIMCTGICYSNTLLQDNDEDKCASCHKKENLGLYEQWKNSKHGEAGILCLDCHGADIGDVDAFEHNGELVATLVTPKDCTTCHEVEAEQTMNSYHANAGEILELP